MKRNRADSAHSAVNAMINAAKDPIPVPAHVRLRDGDKPFWDGILRARARDEWTDADLVVAAQLARCQHDIEVESLALESEDSVVRNERGTLVVNARISVRELLCRTEQALMRTLRMGGRVAGDSRDDAKKRQLEAQARNVRKDLADEEDEPLAV